MKHLLFVPFMFCCLTAVGQSETDGICCDINSIDFTGPGLCISNVNDYDDGLVTDPDCIDFIAVYGCTDTMACNFDTSATLDDGSCEYCSCAENQYSLSVISVPAVQEGLTTYRVYVNTNDADDFVSAVFSNANNPPLSIEVSEGAYNSTQSTSWNASGVNPALFVSFPEIVDDSYATIGLSGPAAPLGTGYTDPGIFDPDFVLTDFFTINGATGFISDTNPGLSWFILGDALNGLPDSNGQILLAQITTSGSISGTLNYQIFPLGNAAAAISVTTSFDGEGVFGGDAVTCGCTEAGACNYNADVTVDDGSCEYVSCNGCMDDTACNFDMGATIDDGTNCVFAVDGYDCDGNCLGDDVNANMVCDSEETGCVDATACNFDANNVFEDNVSCTYAEINYDCDGNCLGIDVNANLICDSEETGCMNSAAWNYDETALFEDGSCFVGGVFTEDFETYTAGDAISTASDLDPWVLWSNVDTEEAFISDDVALSGTKSLKIEGAVATESPMDIALMIGLEGQYEITFSMFVPEGNVGYYNVQENLILGTAWAFNTSLSPAGTISFYNDINNGPGSFIISGQYVSNSWVTITHHIDTDSDLMNVFVNGEFLGQAPYDGTQIGALNFYPSSQGSNAFPMYYVDDIIVDVASPIILIQQGCTDSFACNYNPTVTVDDGSCLELDECEVCGGSGIPQGDCDCEGNTLDVVGICGGNCTLDNDSNGVCDDEEVYGCAYELADNYDVNVTRDDGSCIFPCEGVVNTNVFDWDGDYVVTVTDFLMMLSVYGDTDVDLDGVWDSGDDCVDTNACNYANDPSEPCAYIDVLGVCGGGCEGDEDNDGICDDIDTCIGVEDECGVCNGPGPTEVVIEDIWITYDSVFLPLDNDWYVFPVSADTTFTYTCAPFFGGCGDPVGYQGYDYATVLIGDQCWFAENLRSENYDNGDAIPSNLSDSEWSTTNSGAVAVYGEDAGCDNYSPDIEACDPAQSLEEYGRLYNWYAVDDARGLCPSGWHVPTDGEWTVMTDELGGESIAGGQMKTTYGWYNGGNGTNSSGFLGLPGGFRTSYDGYFSNAGYEGVWWSSSPSGSNAWYRYLYFLENVGRYDLNQRYGFSVRCVRDAE